MIAILCQTNFSLTLHEKYERIEFIRCIFKYNFNMFVNNFCSVLHTLIIKFTIKQKHNCTVKMWRILKNMKQNLF